MCTPPRISSLLVFEPKIVLLEQKEHTIENEDLVVKATLILLLLILICWTKGDNVQSFTVCVRFLVSHFDGNNMLALESRDNYSTLIFINLLHICWT